MENSKIPKNTRIIFPENITSVISEITKKYGLGETIEEIIEKRKRGEIINGSKIAEIIKKAALEEIAVGDLPSVLKKEFNLSIDNSKGLAEDIDKKVLSLAKEISETQEDLIKEPAKENGVEIKKEKKRRSLAPKLESPLKTEKSEELTAPSKEPKKNPKKDVYREPIQ